MHKLHVIKLVYLFNYSLFIISCGSEQGKPNQLLSQIAEKNELVVLTTNQPTTYYIDREGNAAGPEYDMTRSFAQMLGVQTRYVILDSAEAIIIALKNGEGDIAATGLTITSERASEFDFGPAYMDVSEYLICHRDAEFINDIDDLRGLEIVVPTSTSYVDTLYEVFPGIDWSMNDNLITPMLLEKVRSKEIECTISDSTIFDISRRYYPEISLKYTLQSGSQLAWMYEKNNPQMGKVIGKWLKIYKDNGEYARTMEKYYGYIKVFDYVDIQKFKRRIEGRLPKYKDMFLQAAEQHGISPSLLAAQSYQESHWDPKAKSPTGVRGIMMLTQPVAKSLGVTSRLDARQNIFAGAKFHAKLKNMLDEDVAEPDRTWLALAAYNVGRGHFRDAQGLAEQLGKNPNLWVDIKQVLPLLSDKNYYTKLTYGYARGNEPVQYVTRIRDYDDILVRYFN